MYAEYEYRACINKRPFLFIAFKAVSFKCVHVTVMMKLTFKAGPQNNDYTEKAAMPEKSYNSILPHFCEFTPTNEIKCTKLGIFLA